MGKHSRAELGAIGCSPVTMRDIVVTSLCAAAAVATLAVVGSNRPSAESQVDQICTRLDLSCNDPITTQLTPERIALQVHIEGEAYEPSK